MTFFVPFTLRVLRHMQHVIGGSIPAISNRRGELLSLAKAPSQKCCLQNHVRPMQIDDLLVTALACILLVNCQLYGNKTMATMSKCVAIINHGGHVHKKNPLTTRMH